MITSLRELELEEEIASLKHKIMELQHQKISCPITPATMFSPIEPEDVEMSVAMENIQMPKAAACNLAYDHTGGFRINVWGKGEDKDRLLQYAYYCERGYFADRDLPYILDQMHQRFQHGLLDFVKKKKAAA